MVGMVSWLMTLIGYIVDELFILGDFFEDHADEAGNLSLDVLNARSELPQSFRFVQEHN